VSTQGDCGGDSAAGAAVMPAVWAPEDGQSTVAAAVRDLAQALSARQWFMGTAESCTGGGIAYALTALPGSSAWFAGGAVTYTNALKMRVLGVDAATLAQHGAVSEAVVAEMALGALQTLGCQLSVAVSGIAGPGGGSDEKPVGLVCFGWALIVPEADAHAVYTESVRFDGSREQVRMQTIAHAVRGCLRHLAGPHTHIG